MIPERVPAPASSVLAVGLVTLAVAACGPRPKPMNVVEATIPEIQDAVRSGKTTCRQVVQAYLDRIAAYDSATGLNAITVVNPNALARADSLDAARRAGEARGALFCVPMLVKDNYDTHDLPTTGGSIALKDNRPPDDAFVVRRIREAGAIVVAKTNMAEWAFSPRQTVSSSYGTTANAYALDRVPAGSSGGTASGVAASFGLVGLGTDTGNSIRGPSSHLALFGIRSTIGLVSRDGVIPLAFDRDVAGPMARTVADAARVLNVIAGYDPGDPYTELGRDHVATDYTSFLDADGLQGARIGVLRALADPEKSDSSVLRLFDQAVADLRAAGAEIVDPFVIPNLEAHLKADNFCPRFRYDMHQYLASLGPEAPIHDVAEVLETGQYSKYIEDWLRELAKAPLDVPPGEWDPPCPDYADNPGRQAFKRDVVAAMDSLKVDAIAYPTWTYPPAHLDKAREEYRGDNSQLIAPATGMPASTVPMGFSYGKYPTGLQLLARPWDEGVLFRLSYAYEQATHHRRPPPDFPPLSGESAGRATAASSAVMQASLVPAQASGLHYHVVRRIETGGEGWWDYLTVDTAGDRLFVSRGTHIQVVDLRRDTLIADVPGTPGVHGVALADDLGRGFTSNGGDTTVTVFDLKTLKPLTTFGVTGRNPDAILYDALTKRVFTFNHSGGNATVVDAVGDSVLATIPLDGEPEFAVTDGAGRIYVNLEDKSQVAEIDARSLNVMARWSLAPCESPTGLAIDRAHSRLFAGCQNRLMAVMDAGSGRVVTTLPIGAGVDGTRYDPGTQLAFASNGEGTLTVVREEDPDHFTVVETVPTQVGARTLGLDPRTHKVYVATTKFGPAPAPTPDRPHPRPRPIPGTFVVLVLGP